MYTTEAYPALIRNFAVGCCQASTRFAGAVTPSIGQNMLDAHTSFAVFSIYGVSCAAAAVLTAMLPFETRWRTTDGGAAAAAGMATTGGPSRGTPTESTPLRS